MKKILIAFIFVLSCVTTAYAATISSSSNDIFQLNEVNTIQPVAITTEADGEITYANGIRILLDSTKSILWDKVEQIELTGKAVSQGYISEIIKPEYSANYKEVYIPVLKDWPTGITATINGLKFRAYRDIVPYGYFLGLDFTGDKIADVYNNYMYSVTDTSPWSDFTPPYPLTDVQAVKSFDPAKVTLSWNRPPDYDYEGVRVIKTLVRNGVTVIDNQMILNRYNETYYEDSKVQEGDEITYEISADDLANTSEPDVVTLTLVKDVAVQPVENPVQQPTDEMTQLSNLFNYYKGRYSIKCMPSGVPALPSDSACLWARVDIVYAQEMLDRSDVDTAITDYDKELMSKRMKYPEARYQTNCVEAETPADYCSALGKALDRIQYFIEQ